jgi:hypothetical protein
VFAVLERRRIMQSGNFTTEPVSHALSGVTVSAVLQRDLINDIWGVIIVLGRFPGKELIRGEEVDAQLIDRRGEALSVMERPSGPLTEAGGSRGVSANARFRFRGSKEYPDRLVVTYQNQTASFNIIPVETGKTQEMAK